MATDTDLLSPLVWAYIGDAEYELRIRERIVKEKPRKPHKLHILASEIVNAKKQTETFKYIEDMLTEDEKNIARRARNTKNYHLPKNATHEEYSLSTAFEAVIGYHKLDGNMDRIDEIMEKVYDFLEI